MSNLFLPKHLLISCLLASAPALYSPLSTCTSKSDAHIFSPLRLCESVYPMESPISSELLSMDRLTHSTYNGIVLMLLSVLNCLYISFQSSVITAYNLKPGYRVPFDNFILPFGDSLRHN